MTAGVGGCSHTARHDLCGVDTGDHAGADTTSSFARTRPVLQDGARAGAGPDGNRRERAPLGQTGAMATETQTGSPRTRPDEGDHDRFSHYVIGGGEAVMRSALTGEPVTALCGKVWVPSRDPQRYPICPICEEVQAGRDSSLID